MKYFTRAQHEALNSTDPTRYARAIEEFNKNAELYRVQLDALRPRLSPNAEGKRRHAICYRRIRRVVFDYPSAQPWYTRYGDPGSNPIDDWLADELTAADDMFLRHEVLFSSGATLLIEFIDVTIKSTRTI